MVAYAKEEKTEMAPEPAPVVTGPGGDYNKSFIPETINLTETLLKALKATAKTVESLLKFAKK